MKQGFTLIELSIVLVIIGLIIGAVLVGRELISAAGLRSTIAQIDRYQSAVSTFKEKYNNQLPGDIDQTDAIRFGLPLASQRGGSGQGDGNGLLQGWAYGTFGYVQSWKNTVSSENGLFWVDLSFTGLIEGNYQPVISATTLHDNLIPAAKMGQGNYIYTWSGTDSVGNWCGSAPFANDQANHYGLSAVQCIGGVESTCGVVNGNIQSTPGLTVKQAYDLDKKIDDGYPMGGRVMAMYIDNGCQWSGGYNSNMPGSMTTCWDNSISSTGSPGVNNSVAHYSLEMGSTSPNCAVSIMFQ